MIIELQKFVEFKSNWWDGPDKNTRAACLFEPMTINTEYVATIRRYPVFGGVEFVVVSMADHGSSFILDITYEKMRDLLKEARPPSPSWTVPLRVLEPS